MSLKIGCLLTVSVVLVAGCATTRYEEYGPPLDSEGGPVPGPVVPAAAATDSAGLDRVPALEAHLASRLGEIEATNDQLTNRVAALSEQVDQLRRQILSAKESGRSTRTPPPGKPAPAESRVEARRPDDSTLGALYALAMNDYNARRFPQALGRLRELHAMDPSGDLADNAQYWIGECQYAIRDCRAALETFRGVFRYPDTEKDDDAQLKLGLCHVQVGEDETALIELKRLVVDYPDSEYLGRAEELIRQIRRRTNPGP